MEKSMEDMEVTINPELFGNHPEHVAIMSRESSRSLARQYTYTALK
jgi:hypothetical protein